MAAAIVILIILICAGYQYFKGTIVKSFVLFVITVCAGVVAFGYFEILSNLIISRGGQERFSGMVPWAQPLSFVLLFAVSFAVLQLISDQLTRQKVDLGFWPEQIGRVFFGIFTGLVASGLLLTVLVMAPLPSKYPYQRFSAGNPNPARPSKKAFLYADDFATGLFGMLSKGSFSAITEKRSFATLHADFLDQAFLNRTHASDKISIATSSPAVQVPEKQAVWPAPEGLKDLKGRAAPQKSGHRLTVVRVGIVKKMLAQGGTFVLSQLRLVCVPKTSVTNALSGRGKSVYPVGHLRTAEILQVKQLDEKIELKSAEFGEKVKWIDFVFNVPDDSVPALLEFKQNNIVELPRAVPSQEAPKAEPFIQIAACTQDGGELYPIESAAVYGVQLATGIKCLGGFTLKVTDPNHWRKAEADGSMHPARFEGNATSYVRAAMRQVEPDKEPQQRGRAGRRGRRGRGSFKKTFELREMLQEPDGYKLLSLKCNNPSTPASIKGEALPVLLELSGAVHRPVGVCVAGLVGDQKVYEVDYCSRNLEQGVEGLVFSEDGAVTRAFPDMLWLPQQAQKIEEFYALYVVKTGRAAVITEVGTGDLQHIARFKEYDGLFVK